jgi:hypothetical protein
VTRDDKRRKQEKQETAETPQVACLVMYMLGGGWRLRFGSALGCSVFDIIDAVVQTSRA